MSQNKLQSSELKLEFRCISLQAEKNETRAFIYLFTSLFFIWMGKQQIFSSVLLKSLLIGLRSFLLPWAFSSWSCSWSKSSQQSCSHALAYLLAVKVRHWFYNRQYNFPFATGGGANAIQTGTGPTQQLWLYLPWDTP